MNILWHALLGSGALALAVIPVGRYFYTRFYLSRRLFFEPWVNLSRNDSLNVGGSLAELLFFELEGIRRLLEEARSDSGRLWNDKSALPALERSFDGYPEFVRHTELLGLSGRIANLVKFVLLARPQAIRGSIHQFGSALRLQVVLDGVRPKKGESGARCWSSTIDSGEPQAIPEAVAELAHNIVLDIGRLPGFKAPQTFRCFTLGLRQHLAWNTLRRPVFLEQAETYYRQAIEHEGGNAEASCNLGDLLYSQFTYDANEKCIKAYLGALRTEKPLVRARAFRGLANAYCQRRQRHRRGDDQTLEAALRWARFAEDLCGEGHLAPEDQATIKKALAYAQQVHAEFGHLRVEARQAAFQKAVDLYREAIDLNEKFTVAYNNVSYLFLKRADETLRGWQHNSHLDREERFESALRFLEEAEKWCADAIRTDRTFHMAYDNQGNIAAARARLQQDSAGMETQLGVAVECFHRALSYQPAYKEAYSDLARTHARLYSVCGTGTFTEPVDNVAARAAKLTRSQLHHARLAWQHHWDTLTYTDDANGRALACKDFAEVVSMQNFPRFESLFENAEAEPGVDLRCVCLARGVAA